MVSKRSWKPDELMLLTAGVLLSWCAGQLICLLLPRWIPEAAMDQNFLRFTIGTVTFQGAALVLVTQFLHWHQMRWRDMLLSPNQALPKIILTGLGVGLVVALAIGKALSEVIRLVQLPAEEQIAVKVIENAVEPANRVWFMLAAVVLVPAAEETLFRGIMYPFLKQHIGRWAGVTITSILFVAIHLHPIIFSPLVLLACVLTCLYERTDSLLTPILTHAAFNATNLVMLLYLPGLSRWFHGRT